MAVVPVREPICYASENKTAKKESEFTPMNTLDISNWKIHGQELSNRIIKEVKSFAKSKLLVPIPDILMMTQDQYDDLSRLKGMYDVFYTEDKMYRTPFNVMEIRIDKRRKLTFDEVEALDTKSFKEWSKSEGIDE